MASPCAAGSRRRTALGSGVTHHHQLAPARRDQLHDLAHNARQAMPTTYSRCALEPALCTATLWAELNREPPITGKRGIHFGTVAPPNMGQHPTFDPESSILGGSSCLLTQRVPLCAVLGGGWWTLFRVCRCGRGLFYPR